MMQRFLSLCLFLCCLLPTATIQAQTIIELKPGGGVRSKTIDDYKADNHMAEREHADSLAYVDHLRRAFNALHADSLTDAAQCFQAALKLRPNAAGNQVVRYNLALIDIAQKKETEGIKRLTKVINSYPNYYDARLARAKANLQIGHDREVIDDCNTLFDQIGTANATATALLDEARFLRGAAYYETHQYTQARADLEQLLNRQPTHQGALILHSLTLFRMGQPKEALNRLNLIIAAHPDNADALSTRAEVEAELQMNAPACADYDTLIQLEPQVADHYIGRAKMHIRLNNKTAARRDLNQAVKLGTPQGVVQALYILTK